MEAAAPLTATRTNATTSPTAQLVTAHIALGPNAAMIPARVRPNQMPMAAGAVRVAGPPPATAATLLPTTTEAAHNQFRWVDLAVDSSVDGSLSCGDRSRVVIKSPLWSSLMSGHGTVSANAGHDPNRVEPSLTSMDALAGGQRITRLPASGL